MTPTLDEPAAPARAQFTWAQDALAVLVMLAGAIVAGVLFVGYRSAAQPRHPRLTLEEMRFAVETAEALIVDARDRREFDGGHIPAAVNLPVGEWRKRSSELRGALRRHRDRLVVVYCGNMWCGQAEELQQALIDHGHTRVGLFPGGYEAWLDAGLPVSSSAR